MIYGRLVSIIPNSPSRYFLCPPNSATWQHEGLDIRCCVDQYCIIGCYMPMFQCSCGVSLDSFFALISKVLSQVLPCPWPMDNARLVLRGNVIQQRHAWKWFCFAATNRLVGNLTNNMQQRFATGAVWQSLLMANNNHLTRLTREWLL